MIEEDAVAQAILLLESMADARKDPVARVVMPSDAEFMRGNEPGLVRLAVSALRASRGEAQVFASMPWWIDYHDDWELRGFELDVNAHEIVPHVNTLKDKVWGAVVKAFLVGCVVCAFVGARTLAGRLFHF